MRNNLSTGIFAEAAVLVTGNTVYGQSAANAIGISTGYSGAYGGSIVNNVLYANYIGIETDYTGDTIVDNRLYDNSYAAIEADAQLAGFGQRRLLQQHRHLARVRLQRPLSTTTSSTPTPPTASSWRTTLPAAA